MLQVSAQTSLYHENSPSIYRKYIFIFCKQFTWNQAPTFPFRNQLGIRAMNPIQIQLISLNISKKLNSDPFTQNKFGMEREKTTTRGPPPATRREKPFETIPKKPVAPEKSSKSIIIFDVRSWANSRSERYIRGTNALIYTYTARGCTLPRGLCTFSKLHLAELLLME